MLSSIIQLKRTSGTITEFLSDLQKDYSFSFAYDERIIPSHRFKVRKQRWQLADLLQRLLQKNQLKFELVNQQVVIKKQENTRVTVHGTVTNKASYNFV